MPTITLNNGDVLKVELNGTDGQFEIHFDSVEYPKQLVIQETANLPGNRVGEAEAILYHEDLRGKCVPEDGDVADEELQPPDQPVGLFVDADGRVQCTSFVNCVVRENGDPDDITVVTLAPDGTETGEFTFYKSLAALENALGKPVPRTTI
jgi:hypothetical protein